MELSERNGAAVLFGERRRLAAELRRLELRKRLLDELLLGHFQGVAAVTLGGVELLRWQERTQARFDLAAFREAEPELAARFTLPSSYRTPLFS